MWNSGSHSCRHLAGRPCPHGWAKGSQAWHELRTLACVTSGEPCSDSSVTLLDTSAHSAFVHSLGAHQVG